MRIIEIRGIPLAVYNRVSSGAICPFRTVSVSYLYVFSCFTAMVDGFHL